jgi:hypothetical protein
VVEIAEELIETVDRGQVFVTIAQMVLAELPGRITHRLKQLRDSYIARLQANRGARDTNLTQAGP